MLYHTSSDLLVICFHLHHLKMLRSHGRVLTAHTSDDDWASSTCRFYIPTVLFLVRFDQVVQFFLYVTYVMFG